MRLPRFLRDLLPPRRPIEPGISRVEPPAPWPEPPDLKAAANEEYRPPQDGEAYAARRPGVFDALRDPMAQHYWRILAQLTFEELAEANFQRCDQSFHECLQWSVSEWAVALAGEAGEVCDAVKKLNRVESGLADKNRRGPHTREEAIAAIGREIADTVIYCDLLAQRLGLSLDDLVVAKFNEVSERVGAPQRIGPR